MKASHVWMIGTAPSGKGGIATVLQQYQAGGFFSNGDIHFEATHNDLGLIGRWWPFLGCAFKLWLTVLSNRVSLVHAHMSYAGSFWRKLLLVWPAMVAGVPVVIHLHGSKFMEFYETGTQWRRLCIRYLFRNSFRVIALSDEWQQWITSVEPRSHVVVVLNSLSLTTGANRSSKLGTIPTVLFLGRIGRRKGTFDLLQAFAKVQISMPDAQLIVGGDGEAAEFASEVKALNLVNSVHYLGWVDSATKVKLFKDAWVFALPSYQEGLPMAILEAMAYSRAVISCPVGGIPQAVQHGSTGLLVSPGDIPSLASSIVSLLSDREVAERMGRAGRKSFEAKFSNEANWPALIDIYRKAGVTRFPF